MLPSRAAQVVDFPCGAIRGPTMAVVTGDAHGREAGRSGHSVVLALSCCRSHAL